jgi:hypothetical protein
MAFTTRVAWETLRSIDSATLTGVYARVGTPFVHPSYKCKMVNNSTTLVTVSIDGVTDVDVAPANSFWLYDETLALGPNTEFLPEGTQIFVKGSAGVGLIYLVTQYIITN